MVLFNFGEEDFVINMGDRIAQLIFEKIKTPIVKEMNELEETDRGVGGYGSTGMKAVKDQMEVEKETRECTCFKNKWNPIVPVEAIDYRPTNE